MKRLAGIVLLMAVIGGCSLIDDDLSVCGTDYQMHYEVRLETDIQMTIEEKLTLAIEQSMADTLRQWLSPIFSGQAHDLDMSFFSMDGTDVLKHHKNEVIDASQKSYTLYIPREDYMHLAVVNLAQNAYVSLEGTQHASTMRLTQRDGDTLPSLPTAVYTARLPMLMSQDSTEKFDVRLYMVSSAVALVIDSLAVPVKQIDVLYSGGATGFAIKDSVYTYDHPSLIRATKLTDQCYTLVAMPSKDAETPNGQSVMRSAKEEPSYWDLRCYATLMSGSVTETVLSIHKPLEAGTLEIIRINMNADGSMEPLNNNEVGATVKLDWNEGSEHEIEI